MQKQEGRESRQEKKKHQSMFGGNALRNNEKHYFKIKARNFRIIK